MFKLEKSKFYSEAIKSGKSKFHSTIRDETEKIFTIILREKMTQLSTFDVSTFPSDIYPHINNKEKMSALSQIFFVLWLLEDYLEDNPEENNHWIQLINEEIEPDMNSGYERCYKLMVEKLRLICSEQQFQRFMKMMIKFCESYNSKGEQFNSNGEYFQFRDIDGAVESLYLLLEPSMDIDLQPDVLNNQLMIEFFKLFNVIIIAVNDLYSFKREKNLEKSMNYMMILSKKKGIEEQEVMDLMVELIDKTYEEILLCKQKIIESKLNVSVEYLDAVIVILYGNLNWSKSCDRYNKTD